MSIKGKAYIAGISEHPTRNAPDKSLSQLHAEVAKAALEDAGLSKDDVDAYYCAGDAPGLGPLSMVDYLGLSKVRHYDSTDTGGSSYVLHVGHAAEAIAAGKCKIALITLRGVISSSERRSISVTTSVGLDFVAATATRPGLAAAPRPGKPGPGRPLGSKNRYPAPSYDVGKTARRQLSLKAKRGRGG